MSNERMSKFPALYIWLAKKTIQEIQEIQEKKNPLFSSYITLFPHDSFQLQYKWFFGPRFDLESISEMDENKPSTPHECHAISTQFPK